MRRIFRKGVMAMAYYRQCTRCGCSLDTGEGVKYPGEGLVCEECAEELDLEAAYREKWCLTKGQIAELKKELSASLS